MMTKVCGKLWKKVLSDEKKMAAFGSTRVYSGHSQDNRSEELRNGAKNTSKSTSFLFSAWKAWCEGETIALVINKGLLWPLARQ